MTNPEDKMDITIRQYSEAMARAYDDGYKQAQRDLCALYDKAKAPEWAKTGPGGPIGPFWEAE